jgi:signal transduction histidine kinase
LQEVVFNLINNAVEAMCTMTNRNRVLRVRTEVRDEIAVSVQDSGPGIDPKQLDNVYNAFISTKAHGTGLGLAICRMIVEGHDGQISASSDGKKRGAIPIHPANRMCIRREGKNAEGHVLKGCRPIRVSHSKVTNVTKTQDMGLSKVRARLARACCERSY